MARVSEDIAQRAVQLAVLAERTRCLEVYQWSRRTNRLDAAEIAMRDGTTAVELERMRKEGR